MAATITQAQKQALVDNLQLEITERARKLRAQYALQAQSLRTRLEMRVNRIPQALRKRKMQDLLDEHAEKANPKPAPAIPVHHGLRQQQHDGPKKSLKRQSDQISSDMDKENVPSSSQPASTQHDLPNPKKRAKTATTITNAKASRTASRKVVPSTVLSPKSHNSRTLPRSPFKPSGAPPEKPTIRPASPIKPPPAPAIGKRTASRTQAKRGAAATTGFGYGTASENDTGRSSEASNTSAGTTIVTKGAGRAKPAAGGAKKGAAATTKALAAKKGVAAKKENVPPVPTAAAGGRSLRKRN